VVVPADIISRSRSGPEHVFNGMFFRVETGRGRRVVELVGWGDGNHSLCKLKSLLKWVVTKGGVRIKGGSRGGGEARSFLIPFKSGHQRDHTEGGSRRA